jgi:adenylate kinase family enzyme
VQRVAVIGSGGAGKSTLARQMGERLGLRATLRSRSDVARFLAGLDAQT